MHAITQVLLRDSKFETGAGWTKPSYRSVAVRSETSSKKPTKQVKKSDENPLILDPPMFKSVRVSRIGVGKE